MRGVRLGAGRVVAGAVTDRHRQCGELHQTVVAACRCRGRRVTAVVSERQADTEVTARERQADTETRVRERQADTVVR